VPDKSIVPYEITRIKRIPQKLFPFNESAENSTPQVIELKKLYSGKLGVQTELLQ